MSDLSRISQDLISNIIYDIIFICGKKQAKSYVEYKSYVDLMRLPLYGTSLNIPEKTSIRNLTFLSLKGKILI